MTRLTIPGDSPFGLANLPYGVYSAPGQEPRVATRYGDHVVASCSPSFGTGSTSWPERSAAASARCWQSVGRE
jgi:hypothetical protein